jgi:hypothetical protein
MAEQQDDGRGATARVVTLGAMDGAGIGLPGCRSGIPVPQILRSRQGRPPPHRAGRSRGCERPISPDCARDGLAALAGRPAPRLVVDPVMSRA